MGSPRLHRFFPQRPRVDDRSCRAQGSSRFFRRLPVPPLAPFLRSSALRSSRVTGLSATKASADFSPALTEEISPGKVQNLFPRAAWLYLMRLDDLWASLFRASLPPASGLTASSCSYGREFASRFFQLCLAATPCGSATVAVIGPDWLLSSNKILPMLGTPCGGLQAAFSGAVPLPTGGLKAAAG